MDTCNNCPRPLQDNAMAEITGLCDHCREVVVLERTPLANAAFTATTRPTWRERVRTFLTTDPDNCQCGACGDWQDDLDRWEQHG